MNGHIRAKSVRLIDNEGNQLGVVEIDEAIRLAKEKDLDLLLVSETADPPVCKIINFGQFKYQQAKKDKLTKKSSRQNVLKELKMSPKIGQNDYQIRVNRGREFLKKGYRVKLSIPFRGREIVHPDLGQELVRKYLESVSDVGLPDGIVNSAHRSLVVIINPKT